MFNDFASILEPPPYLGTDLGTAGVPPALFFQV